MDDSPSRPSRKKSPALVRTIGAFKLVKALVLGAAAVGLFTNQRLESMVWRVFGYLSERTLHAAGIATGVYALVFLVEGIGLLLVKRWAEWLTVIVTGSFIPLEVYKLYRHVSAPGIVALAINVAVVIYLAWRLKVDKPRAADRSGAAASLRRRTPATAPARPA